MYVGLSMVLKQEYIKGCTRNPTKAWGHSTLKNSSQVSHKNVKLYEDMPCSYNFNQLLSNFIAKD